MKKFITTLFLGLTALSGMSCTAMPVKGEMTPLGNYEIINGTILSFTAQSTGCSQNRHFTIDVKKQTANTVSVSVLRITKDPCKRMPFFKTFKLILPPDLQGKKLLISNPQAPVINKEQRR